MRAAILDLGTNTFHLLAVEYTSANEYTIIARKQYVVKLGEGGINNHHIMKAPYQRGMDALKSISQELQILNITTVKAFATSAIRSANNGKTFIADVLAQTGIVIEAISGEQEAIYIYEGVRQSVSISRPYLVMDIGGGSVEFIIGNTEQWLWKQSFAIGAARLIDFYHRQDPIDNTDLERLHQSLDETLQPLFEALQKFPTTILVGAAGSFESIFDLSKLAPYTGLSTEFSINTFKEIHETLLQSTAEERALMPGLASFRIEMMVVASVLIHYIINRCGIQQLYISKNSLKEGALLSLAHTYYT
jgi:exopolyphosphatase/guanosine-5'-triphosphate,3'-diphosphate pyrophosphatase